MDDVRPGRRRGWASVRERRRCPSSAGLADRKALLAADLDLVGVAL
ncbi:hypothetical protein ABZ669_17125 [Streptomyces hirsutus]